MKTSPVRAKGAGNLGNTEKRYGETAKKSEKRTREKGAEKTEKSWDEESFNEREAADSQGKAQEDPSFVFVTE